MKTLTEKIQGLSFKKAFVVLFAAALALGATFAGYMTVNDQWNAVHERRQTVLVEGEFAGRHTGRSGRFGHSGSHGRGHSRGHMSRGVVVTIPEGDAATGEVDEVIVTISREGFGRFSNGHSAGFRGGHTGHWNGTTPTTLGVFAIIGSLLHFAFRLLLAAWVFVDSQKHGKNRALWPILTLATSVLGFVIYLISREHKGRASKSAV
ncbi:MAG: hypothetical protein FWE19_07735 [Oscillospiraceae bacterium]|nr:hypothetical protein [Oscillospiraceae bacterium]